MLENTLNDLTQYIDFIRSKGYFVALFRFDTVFKICLPTLLWYEEHRFSVCNYLKQCKKTKNVCICHKKKLLNIEFTKIFYSCCWAGVEEYIVPIFYDEKLIMCINVSGYRGNIDKSKAIYNQKRQTIGGKYIEYYDQLSTIKPHLQEIVTITRPIEYIARELYRCCANTADMLTKQNDLCNQICAFIVDNYMNNVTCKDIAKEVHYSESYINHIFKQKNSISISEYLKETRLNTAKNLLLNTNYSITKIANDCGFDNSNYFSTAFKNKYKISPREYRNSSKTVQ